MDLQRLVIAAPQMGVELSPIDIQNIGASLANLPPGSISLLDILYNIKHFGVTTTVNYINNNRSLAGTSNFVFNQPALSSVNDDYKTSIELALYQPRFMKTDIQCKNPKCRAKTVQYKRVQIRAGDEGSSIIYDCMTCGDQWTQ